MEKRDIILVKPSIPVCLQQQIEMAQELFWSVCWVKSAHSTGSTARVPVPPSVVAVARPTPENSIYLSEAHNCKSHISEEQCWKWWKWNRWTFRGKALSRSLAPYRALKKSWAFAKYSTNHLCQNNHLKEHVRKDHFQRHHAHKSVTLGFKQLFCQR